VRIVVELRLGPSEVSGLMVKGPGLLEEIKGDHLSQIENAFTPNGILQINVRLHVSFVKQVRVFEDPGKVVETPHKGDKIHLGWGNSRKFPIQNIETIFGHQELIQAQVPVHRAEPYLLVCSHFPAAFKEFEKGGASHPRGNG
jgi:hypothetical protein